MDVGNDHMDVDCKFGLETDSQQLPYKTEGTHVKDMEDPVEVQPPGRDRFFIVL